MKNIKKLIASALLAVFIGLQSVPVYADGSVGDPNIENGGGGLTVASPIAERVLRHCMRME